MEKREPLPNTTADRKPTSRFSSGKTQSPRYARYETPKRPIAGIITAKKRYFGEIYNIGHVGAFFLGTESVKADTVGKMGIQLPTFFSAPTSSCGKRNWASASMWNLLA